MAVEVKNVALLVATAVQMCRMASRECLLATRRATDDRSVFDYHEVSES